MNRRQLEHALRAAASVAAADELVVVGSQAILGAFPDAPAELLSSMEVDVYPLHAPERADLIDGSIGELSPFHETFGYYAHGVSPETAALPTGWRNRLVKVANENTGGATGWCISPADLAISKLVAGREKDMDFVRALLKHGMITVASVSDLLAEMPVNTTDAVRARLERLTSGAR
jgi:hypothetical protein